MRRPDRTELEFTMLLFAGLAPVGYYTWRFVMALLQPGHLVAPSLGTQLRRSVLGA
ncbi:hypothetical protein ACWPM1_13535 [Tsuneonella sp. HG249]